MIVINNDMIKQKGRLVEVFSYIDLPPFYVPRGILV